MPKNLHEIALLTWAACEVGVWLYFAYHLLMACISIFRSPVRGFFLFPVEEWSPAVGAHFRRAFVGMALLVALGVLAGVTGLIR